MITRLRKIGLCFETLKDIYITANYTQRYTEAKLIGYLHIKSEHPKSLKYSLPSSQAIRIKRISLNQVDLNNSFKKMKNNFVKQGYHASLNNEHLERMSLLNRSDLITEKDTQQKSDRIPFVITCNRFLPSITKTIRKNRKSYKYKKFSKINL